MGENIKINNSEQQLKRRIKELEEVVSHLKKEKNELELLSFPWVGNLGQWYWMVDSNQVEFNEKKVTNLGYDMKKLPKKIGFEFFTSKLHPDDYENVMENMRKHLMNLSDAYEVEYRILAENGEYIWYYDRGKVTKRDKNGKPLVVSGIVFDINKSKIIEKQLKEANEKLKLKVITDPLTGAFNRRFMLEQMEKEIQRYNRTKSSFSIVMLDIDHFKLVNDNFGHNVGDIVLKKLVQTVKEKIRKTDILCRWGGEEFIIFLPDTNLSGAAELAEKIRIKISEMPIDKVGTVTASFGVSCYNKDDNVDTVVKRADDLMYKAKSEGRNCVRY